MRLHLVGIKGVGMTNLAVLLKKMGYKVKGSDVGKEYITDKLLRKHKIPVLKGFSPKNIGKTDRVIFTGAHKGEENVEVQFARRMGVKTLHQSEFIGKELLPLFKNRIGIAGTHGKTTTSSLVAYGLLNLGQKTSYIVGAPFFNNDFEGGDYLGKEYFVLEADEYAISPPKNLTPKFFYYDLDFIILPSLDFDHPDVFKDIEEVEKAFIKFLEKNPKATVFLNREDKDLIKLSKKVPNKKIFFGFSKGSQIRVFKPKFFPDGSRFIVEFFGKEREEFEVSLLGEHNILNAAGVIGLFYFLGFSPQKIRKAVKGFFGAKRRLEFKGYYEESMVFDDYAHHPSEIEATLKALKTAFPGKRILAIFQPHTYSRTQALLKKFALALSKADYSLILPIFASAREKKDDFKISSQDLIKEIEKRRGKTDFAENFEKVFQKARELKNIDIILTIGAGNVYECLDYFPLKNES